MSNSSFSFFQRQSIGVKLFILPIIFTLALIAMVVFIVISQQERYADANLIDISARQRTLVQYYTKAVVLETRGVKGDYQHYRKVFEQTLESLLNGGEALQFIHQSSTLTLPPAPTDQIRNSLLKQKDIFQQLESQEQKILELKADTQNASRLLDEMDQTGDQLHNMINETNFLYKSYVNQKMLEMTQTIIIVGIFIVVLCLVLSWILSRAISLPLRDLTLRAQKVSAGDLGGDPLNVTSQDEVGQLTSAFNLMTLNLKELTQQNLEGIKNLSATAAEILASTQQQSASTQEQVTAVQQTTATMEELKQSGSQIAERAKHVAAEAEVSTAVAEKGLEAVQEMVNLMAGILEQVNDLAENIVSLSEKNRAVGDIIAIVTDIADQSNLLALNAAIEAASAGEQGRSFAVVATEMKHLADQAKDATTQIRSILEDIQKGVTKAVMLTEEAVKRVEGGRLQTDSAENTIHKMANTTQQSIQAFQQIVAATNQQQLGLEQVFQALQDIRQSSKQTAASTHQLNQASNSLNVLSQQLKQLVTRYSL